ncbi:MAG: type IV pilus secretin PilQ, partial [Desulfobacula sp.]|nr:type IV pilus secretin PilQ [Desulfobacula sp.]
NVDIKSVPWNHVFLSLLDTYGLTHEWSGLILRVITVADLNKKKELMEAKQDYQQSKNQHSIAMLQIKKKQDWFEPLQTKIIKIQYADIKVMQHNLEEYLTTEIKDASKKQATEKGVEGQTGELRGSIMIDEFTNSLIIQATASEIDKIMPIINELDKPIKQIRIEAHIVEANTDVAKELGIEWGGLGLVKKGDNRRGWIGGDMGSSNTSLKDSDGNNIFHNPSDGSIVNLPITETDPVKGLALGIMAESLGNFRLYAQLSALEEEGELNILSKPSITTMDHRKAIIKSGEEVPYQTVTSDGEIQVEFKEAVIKLEVVPHIINDRIIRLEIVTHKDELDWTNTVNGNPTIITKNAETQVTLFDGQTTVIGGLNKEKSIEGESGVPGLKNVPGLGWLFKSTKKSNDMEELLIFITPYVLQEQGRF